MRNYLSFFSILLMAYSLWLTASIVFADVPHLIRYQGVLVDDSDPPVPLEGLHNVTFRLYTDPDDPAPETCAEQPTLCVWEETYDQTNQVLVTNGAFTVLLGSLIALDPALFDQDLWLSIKVGTEDEMSPRQQMTSVPLAMRTEVAERLEGPLHIVENNVGIGTTSPSAMLDVRGGNINTSEKIQEDGQALLPAGAIILWDGAACPAGYTAMTSYNDQFLVASTTAGLVGGSNTHTHNAGSYSGPSHTHNIPATAPIWGRQDGNYEALAPAWPDQSFSVSRDNPTGYGGNSPITGTSEPTDSRPVFKTILLCKKD